MRRQQQLLESRYDLANKAVAGVKMTRGKAVQVGSAEALFEVHREALRWQWIAGHGHPERHFDDKAVRDARSAADLVGYFGPHEGSATTAYGFYHVESLAAYEAYRARLRDDPLGRENYAFAKRERFILREDRVFLRLASGPHAPLVRP